MMMNLSDSKSGRVFSLQEANAMLPLVRTIVKDIVDLADRIIRTRQRVSFINAFRDEQATGFERYQEETEAISDSLSEDEQRLADCISELQALGIEVNELTEGLVDFPAQRNGERVYFSWRHGEQCIKHWRIPNANSSADDLDSGPDVENEMPSTQTERLPLNSWSAECRESGEDSRREFGEDFARDTQDDGNQERN